MYRLACGGDTDVNVFAGDIFTGYIRAQLFYLGVECSHVPACEHAHILAVLYGHGFAMTFYVV